MTTYMICDVNGNGLADGLQAHEARCIAQRMANNRGEPVWLSESDSTGMGEKFVPKWNAKIIEQGNGLPDCGDYVTGDDGELYVIIRIEDRINTGHHPGDGNWCRARVLPVDWDNVDEAKIFPAQACLATWPPHKEK